MECGNDGFVNFLPISSTQPDVDPENLSFQGWKSNLPPTHGSVDLLDGNTPYLDLLWSICQDLC